MNGLKNRLRVMATSDSPEDLSSIPLTSFAKHLEKVGVDLAGLSHLVVFAFRRLRIRLSFCRLILALQLPGYARSAWSGSITLDSSSPTGFAGCNDLRTFASYGLSVRDIP